ncbi:MAG: restriction endonuclease subunit S [Candidatus Aenigmatarchaeota archaeon]
MVSQIKTHKIPEDWKIVKLKDICEIIRGTEPGSKTYNKEGKGYRFIRVSDLSKQVLEPVFTTEKKENLVFSNKDDILLALDGVPGVVGRGYEGAISSGIRIIRPKNDNVNKDFIFYALQHGFVQKIIKSYTTGTTIKHAGKSVEFIKIPLPPLHEQQKIVEILSLVDLAIEKSNQLIEKTEKLKKLLMRHLLTKGIGHKEFKDTEIGKIPKDWSIVKLKDITNYVKGKRPSILYYNKVREDFLPYLEAEFMRGENFPKWCDPNDSNIIKVKRGDITMIWDGSYAGNVFIGHEGILSSTMIKIEPKNDNIINNLFLYYYLQKIFEIFHKTTTGSTIPHVNKTLFENLLVPLPSLEEQKKIVEILSTIDKKLELERKRKEKLEKIKKILLDLLLTGKIRVKI